MSKGEKNTESVI